MTLTYLQQTASAQVNASGNALVVLRPDVGQWWQCSLVRVSTVSQTPPVAYAAVYHGSQAAIGPTTFIDDTFQANNDTSTIVSGVVIQFGDAITVQFKNGTPGDTAIVTLYGQTSDRPDEFKLLSPGTHFVGHAPTGTTSVILNSESNTLISGTVTRNLGFVGNYPYVGVRFNSRNNAFRVVLQFFADSAYTIPLNPFSFDVNGSPSSTFSGSVPVGGPFCQATVTPALANSNFDFSVWSAPAEFTVPTSTPDNMILLTGESVAAPVGLTTQTTMMTFPGSAEWSISSLLTTWDATLYANDYLGNVEFIHKTDNSAGLPRRQMIPVFLPPMPIQLKFNNATAGAGNYNVSLIARPWTPGR